MNYKHISQAGTYLVKAGRGVLKRIVVNTTSAGAINIYDNVSGEGHVIGVMKANIAENSYKFGNTFWEGLVIKTEGASDITVIYE